jgi:AAA+ superfamily predicted ATPase
MDETSFTGDISEFGNASREHAGRVDPRPEIAKECAPPLVNLSPFLRQWAKVGDDEYSPVGECCNILPAGLYDFYMTNRGPVYVKKKINVDTLIDFPDSLSESVLQEISRFWSSKEAFEKYGFLQRRGYMLYGPQGSGKSCLVQQIVKGVIDKGGLAFLGNHDPGEFGNILHTLRVIEPLRPIMCLFEDIDAIISRQGEAELLSLLDGEIQISNVLNVATTNYPERLDKRIIARPRRFDRLIKVNMPEARIRRIYLEHKLKDTTSEEIELWVSSTDKFSFAALADLVISVKCLGNNFEDTITILKKIQTKSVSSKEFDMVSVGFKDNGHNGEDHE